MTGVVLSGIAEIVPYGSTTPRGTPNAVLSTDSNGKLTYSTEQRQTFESILRNEASLTTSGITRNARGLITRIQTGSGATLITRTFTYSGRGLQVTASISGSGVPSGIPTTRTTSYSARGLYNGDVYS